MFCRRYCAYKDVVRVGEEEREMQRTAPLIYCHLCFIVAFNDFVPTAYSISGIGVSFVGATVFSAAKIQEMRAAAAAKDAAAAALATPAASDGQTGTENVAQFHDAAKLDVGDVVLDVPSLEGVVSSVQEDDAPSKERHSH
jgi:hypothetical protein